MKQQVDITLKLSLWLDADMDKDDIVTHVRAALPNAFGEALTDMTNPVDILEVKQEAEIYGDPGPQENNLNTPWSLHFHRDGTEDVAMIRDSKGEALATSRHFWMPEGDDPTPPTLAGMRVMVAAPKLLEALDDMVKAWGELADFVDSQKLLTDFDKIHHAVKARDVARAAIAEATDDTIGRLA